MLDALAASEGIELDLLQVGDIDTAGLQLLLLLKKEGQRTHIGAFSGIEIAVPPKVIRELLRRNTLKSAH